MKFKEDCIFCKIANKLIPAEIIEETDGFIVIKDMNPIAPIHLLIISKSHYDSVLDIGLSGGAYKSCGGRHEEGESGNKNEPDIDEKHKSGGSAGNVGSDDKSGNADSVGSGDKAGKAGNGNMENCDGIDGRELFGILGSLADKFKVADKGFRTVINTKEDGGQTVNHLHVHFMAGRGFGWPPG
jgi:diadenosine tetraphosphate (Ap4A) HIT family hydrolase